MKITYKGDYALKIILYLAINYGKGVITIPHLSGRLDIPEKFLEQILLELKRGGFVKSKRGKEGGYFLAKHPSEIKLGEIIRFIEGEIEPIACVDINYKGFKDIYSCVFRKIWVRITQETLRIIDTVSFEDLANEIKAQEKSLIYVI